MISNARQLLGGRFVLDSRIGAGNFAEIFRATDTRTNESVAIKTLRSEHSAEKQAISLFEKEGEIGSAISHINVVKILSHGVEDDVHFIVMELVRGISLRRRLTLAGRLSVGESLRIMQAVLRGLEAIHDAGYIHRDIKPQNILLDVTGAPKIIDFGIALSPGEPRLETDGLALGTAAYIAPEQAAGEETGPQADVYSAGAVLFEMLTGEAPFPGDDPIAVMNRHLFEPPRDPRTINTNVSPALATVVTRALAKEPAARFASAAHMRQALEILETDATHQSPSRRFIPTGNLAWTVPIGSSRRLPARLLGMPALTTFVSALLLVVLIIVLMLALVSSLATANDSRGQISSSGPPSGFANGLTPFDDLRPSRSQTATNTRPIPNWFASAAVSDANQTSLIAVNQANTSSSRASEDRPLTPTQTPVAKSNEALPPAPEPASTPQSTDEAVSTNSALGASSPIERQHGRSKAAGKNKDKKKPGWKAQTNHGPASTTDKPQKADKPTSASIVSEPGKWQSVTAGSHPDQPQSTLIALIPQLKNSLILVSKSDRPKSQSELFQLGSQSHGNGTSGSSGQNHGSNNNHSHD